MKRSPILPPGTALQPQAFGKILAPGLLVLLSAGLAHWGLQAEHVHSGTSVPTLVKPIPGAKDGQLTLSKWRNVAKGERHESPDLVVDNSGTTWVTWLAFDNASEDDLSDRIMLRRYDRSGRAAAPIVIDGGDAIHMGPKIATDGYTHWITWSAKKADRWEIYAVSVNEGRMGEIHRISTGQRDALRPVIGLDGYKRPWIAWEERRGNQFAVVARPFDKRAAPLTVSLAEELNLRPSLAPDPKGGLWIAWDSYDDGQYLVQLRKIGGERLGPTHFVTEEPGWHLAPNLAMGQDGTLWITWHTNLARDGHQTISQRLRVRAFKDGRFWDPAIGQPPPIQASLGGQVLQVEDTVEFPTSLVDSRGRLWITARRGQGYIGLIGDGEKWHGPYDLAKLGWGGRGRAIQLAETTGGVIATVARRMHRLALQWLTPPRGLTSTSIPLSPHLLKIEEHPASLAENQSWDGDLAKRKRQFAVDVARDAATIDAGLATLPAQGKYPDQRTASLVPTAVERQNDRPDMWMRPWFGADGVANHHLKAPPIGDHLLLGDIHTHSWHSDGTGDPDQIFVRARDKRGLDFVALTDHDISNGNILNAGEYAYIQLISDFFNDPGRFVTIKGYEWTSQSTLSGGSGHKNVYFPGDETAFFGYGSGVNTTPSLFGHLQEMGAIAIPHHIGWTGTDWIHHDPEVQPNFEIVSVHGAFEYPNNEPVAPRANLDGMFVQDGLNQGLKFGVVGGSDAHGVAWHYGVSRKLDPWDTGLTGVYAREMDRESVVEALRNRRCFATSGPPILVHLQGNDASMGQEAIAQSPLTLRLRVSASAPLLSITLVKDGEELRIFKPTGHQFTAELTDGDLSPGAHYYYVRAVQSDGEVAWSSPVFLNIPTPPLEASVTRPNRQ